MRQSAEQISLESFELMVPVLFEQQSLYHKHNKLFSLPFIRHICWRDGLYYLDDRQWYEHTIGNVEMDIEGAYIKYLEYIMDMGDKPKWSKIFKDAGIHSSVLDEIHKLTFLCGMVFHTNNNIAIYKSGLMTPELYLEAVSGGNTDGLPEEKEHLLWGNDDLCQFISEYDTETCTRVIHVFPTYMDYKFRKGLFYLGWVYWCEDRGYDDIIFDKLFVNKDALQDQNIGVFLEQLDPVHRYNPFHYNKKIPKSWVSEVNKHKDKKKEVTVTAIDRSLREYYIQQRAREAMVIEGRERLRSKELEQQAWMNLWNERNIINIDKLRLPLGQQEYCCELEEGLGQDITVHQLIYN